MISFFLMMKDNAHGQCAWCEKKHKHKWQVRIMRSENSFCNVFFCTKRCRDKWWQSAFMPGKK